MDREQARNYLRSSGMSEEQIAEVESAFTCEDAISRQAVDRLIDELARAISYERCFVFRGRNPETIMQDILDLPSVSTEKAGQWKRISMDKYVQHAMAYYRCSECGKDNIGESIFCPNCGCFMKGDNDERS